MGESRGSPRRASGVTAFVDGASAAENVWPPSDGVVALREERIAPQESILRLTALGRIDADGSTRLIIGAPGAHPGFMHVLFLKLGRRPLVASFARLRGIATLALTLVGCSSSATEPGEVSSQDRSNAEIVLRLQVTDEGAGVRTASAELREPSPEAGGSYTSRFVRLEVGDRLLAGGVALERDDERRYAGSLADGAALSLPVAFERGGAEDWRAEVAFPAPVELESPKPGERVSAKEGVRFAWTGALDETSTREFLVLGECLRNTDEYPVGLAPNTSEHRTAPLEFRSSDASGECDADALLIETLSHDASAFARESYVRTRQLRRVRVHVVQ